MNAHALRVLEYERIREILTAYASNALGRARIAALEPLIERETIERLQREVEEMRALTEVARVPISRFKEVIRALRKRADGGRPGEPDLLYAVLELLRGTAALRETLTREAERFPTLAELGARFEDAPDLREGLESALDARDGVRDDATERLAGIRVELRGLRESLRKRITRRLADPRLQRAIQSEGIKFKDDRYLLPIKADYRQSVPGVIRDRSHTGATLYIEPDDLVIDGDALIRLIDDERNEVQRILWELTRDVLAREDLLARLEDLVGHVDLTCAKARWAKTFELTRPIVGSDTSFELELREARHPYLCWLSRDEAAAVDEVDLDACRQKVVPLDVRLDDGRQILIVTGPNTGGKTVALKTIGLNALMALSGLPIAASSGSRVPIVSNVFADIGDEQSIEQSLSTFSSHLTQIQEILGEGDSNSLVLLDELGAGTDPLEGAALATALLDWFHEQGWHGVITTHLGSLKEFAFLREHAENASMEFDPISLEPTFRMLTGLPGVSHALEIARRLGVPDDIVSSAQTRVDETQAPTKEIIEKMVTSHRRMEKERRRMQRLRQRAQGERRAAEEERDEARVEREAWRSEAEQLLDDVIRSARIKLAVAVEKLRGVPKRHQPAVDELRWMVELLLTATPLGERREAFARSLKKDDEVYVPKFRERCKVRKINKGDRVVTVSLNGIPTAVSFDDVSWVDGK